MTLAIWGRADVIEPELLADDVGDMGQKFLKILGGADRLGDPGDRLVLFSALFAFLQGDFKFLCSFRHALFQ